MESATCNQNGPNLHNDMKIAQSQDYCLADIKSVKQMDDFLKASARQLTNLINSICNAKISIQWLNIPHPHHSADTYFWHVDQIQPLRQDIISILQRSNCPSECELTVQHLIEALRYVAANHHEGDGEFNDKVLWAIFKAEGKCEHTDEEIEEANSQ